MRVWSGMAYHPSASAALAEAEELAAGTYALAAEIEAEGDPESALILRNSARSYEERAEALKGLIARE